MAQFRIALAGFSHETNTFVGGRTDLGAFVANGLYRGNALRALRGTNTVVGGVVDAVAGTPDRFALVPLLATGAIPGGLVTADAFEAIAGEIIAGLERTRPDAVVLDVHGAMVSEAATDGDAEIVRRVRAAVGPRVPIIAVLDLHANLSPDLVAPADVLLPYDTYPHVDTAERGAEAVHLAGRLLSGEIQPTTALRKLPLLTSSPPQRTGAGPMAAIAALAAECERLPGVLNVGVTPGFAYADVPDAGFGILVTTDRDRALAERLASELADFVWDRREAFRPQVLTVEQAIHAAMAEPGGPVVLADLGDNPGGGTPADGTALLWGLLDLGAPNAALALIADPQAVATASAAGVGARVELSLGGKTDEHHGYPIDVTATVRSLSDGRFTYEGPMNAGLPGNLGRTAVLACDGRYGHTVEVIVCERRVQPLDAAIFRSQGIEPRDRQVLGVKSAVHFRGSFEPLAHRIIEVDTIGLTSIALDHFPYRHVRRPIWPLDG